MVVAVAVGGEEVAEGLAGDLAAVEEEVEVHGELAPGRQAPAQHVEHGAHHAPQPPRRTRLRRDHHVLLLLLRLLLLARHFLLLHSSLQLPCCSTCGALVTRGGGEVST
uniref:Uncharacterized protein n=1 Tax=Arundo donax TaxID=35708 RepID=A0A0A9GWE4_ARUDO